MDSSKIVVALLAGMGARILIDSIATYLYGTPTTATTETIIDYEAAAHYANVRTLVVGIWEGFVLYYVFQESEAVGAGLVVGFAGRIIYDYAQTSDLGPLARTLFGIALGVFIAELASQLWVEVMSSTSWSSEEQNLKRRSSRRRRRVHVTEEIRPVELPPGYQDDDAISEVASLEREASAAAGHHRRLEEERSWALAQGNAARSFQLESEIKRYRALSEELANQLKEKTGKGKPPFMYTACVLIPLISIWITIDPLPSAPAAAGSRHTRRRSVTVEDRIKTHARRPSGSEHRVQVQVEEIKPRTETFVSPCPSRVHLGLTWTPTIEARRIPKARSQSRRRGGRA